MSRKDFRRMEKRYDILHLDEDSVILWSRKSKQYWRILKMKDDRYVIFHKHRYGERYHSHDVAVSLDFAIDKVVGHDRYNSRKYERCA